MTIQTNNDPAVAEEVAGIKHALDALLTVATDKSLIRRFAPPRKEEELRPFNFGELIKSVDASQAARATTELIATRSARRSVPPSSFLASAFTRSAEWA
jgi:hypothetical protein